VFSLPNLLLGTTSGSSFFCYIILSDKERDKDMVGVELEGRCVNEINSLTVPEAPPSVN
jgi:hypothetical protein